MTTAPVVASVAATPVDIHMASAAVAAPPVASVPVAVASALFADPVAAASVVAAPPVLPLHGCCNLN